MEKRRRQRIAKRMTCEVEAGSERAKGIVRDVSEHGLFIQTSMTAEPDSLVHVVFPPIDHEPEIRIEAGVARKRVIPRRLQTSVRPGLGLEIIPPRHAFERLVARIDGHAFTVSPGDSFLNAPGGFMSRPGGQNDLAVQTFRFRLVRRDLSASQVLTIRCATEAGARARALARVGVGWKIADLQKL